jgi:hypothetical protein
MLRQFPPVDNSNQAGKASFPLHMIADAVPVGEDHVNEPALFFDGIRQPVNIEVRNVSTHRNAQNLLR